MKISSACTSNTPWHPLPPEAGLCVVIPGFFSPAECSALIAADTARGFASAATDYPPSYRNNERQVVDDAALAQRMLTRLQGVAPATLARADGAWTLDAVNPRFRHCRYRPGQQFTIHQDGVHHRGEGHQSCLTFMVYLSDGDSFEGGDTVFYAGGPGAGEPVETGRVRPRAGSLILFDHALWHAGAVVTAGVKHIMRSDLLYRRSGAAPARAAGPFQPGHDGYVWTLERLADGRIASGGRDGAIRLWSAHGAAAGCLSGHTQSVLGLAALPGRRLASVARDRTLRLWDLDTGQCEQSVAAHEGAVLAVAALPDGAMATGGADGALRLWDGGGLASATLAGHQGWVWAVAALGATQIASASEDGSVRIWDRHSGRCLHCLPGSVPLRTLAVAASGQLIVAGNIAGELTVWQAAPAGWMLVRRVTAHSAALRRVRMLAPDLLASTGEDNMLRCWDLADWRLRQAWQHDHFVTDVLAMDGALLSCSYGGQLKLQGGNAVSTV